MRVVALLLLLKEGRKALKPSFVVSWMPLNFFDELLIDVLIERGASRPVIEALAHSTSNYRPQGGQGLFEAVIVAHMMFGKAGLRLAEVFLCAVQCRVVLPGS